MKPKWLLITLLLFNYFYTLAQQLSFSRIGLTEGLSQSSVYNIFQDKQGFMWFSTGDGLNKYDGYEIKTYNVEYNKNIIGSGNFYDQGAVQSKNCDIYFSGRNGVNIYKYKEDKIIRFFPNGDTTTFNNLIDVLGIDSNENLYLFNSSIIFRYNINTHILKKIPLKDPTNKKTLFRHGKMDTYGRIWYSLHNGIGCYDTRTLQYKFFLMDMNKQLGKTTLRGICEYDKDEIIISSTNYIIKLNYNTGIYNILKTNFDENINFDVVVDHQKRIWISSLRDGLVCFDKDKTYKYHFNKNNSNSIGSNMITKLYIDKSNNLWVGCDGQGVSKTNLFLHRFNLYRSDILPSIQLNSEFIKCFIEDEEGMTWFSAYDEGLHKLNRKNNTIQVFKQSWINSNIINDIIGFGKDNLLVASAGGVFTFNLKTNKAKQIPIKSKSKHAPLNSILYTQQKNLLLAGSSGFYRATVLNNKIKDYFIDSTVIPYQFAVKLFQSKSGKIWIGTIGGPLYILTEKGTHLTLINSMFNGYNIRCFYEDTLTNTLWMASEKGLIKYNLTNNKYEIITTKNGLANNYLYSILPGQKYELWLSSNNGLLCYNTKYKTCINFDISDGLQSNEFNTGSYYKSTKGELFFGGINGFNCFYPNNIKLNKNVPNIALTQLKIQDQDTNEFGNPAALKEIELIHTRNTISFYFSALEFTNSAKNKYQYLLEGVDPNWINSGTTHYTRYSSLAPGKYSFYVKASNNDGLWSEPKQLLKIIIKAPWWQQWWAKILFAFVIIGLFIVIIRYLSVIKLKKKLQELEKKEAINHERSRISKDMHDDLGSGLSKISLMSELLRNELMPDNNDKIQKIAKTASDLVDNMSHIIWAMNPENDYIDNLTAYIREFTLNFLESYNLPCQINFPDSIPAHHLTQEARRNCYLVIKESLHNIVKHAQATNVTIELTMNENKLCFKISDNGNGFDTADIRKFGNGLNNMRKRMEQINGIYSITSTLGSGTTTEAIIYL